MQSLSDAKKFLLGALFLLLAIFAPLHPRIAVTVEEIYSDDAVEGFKDETDLTQAEKDLISPSGNDSETLGEARKKAFEYATPSAASCSVAFNRNPNYRQHPIAAKPAAYRAAA